MNVLDVNVVIALFRPDHRHHEPAMRWWTGSVLRGQQFTVPDVCWVGFARMATNPRVFAEPATLAEVREFAEAVMTQPSYLAFTSSPTTLAEFARTADDAQARGDLVTDAYIAACAATYGGTVVTFDRDFRRFDGLRVLELAA